jgi:hypothetical protein
LLYIYFEIQYLIFDILPYEEAPDCSGIWYFE